MTARAFMILLIATFLGVAAAAAAVLTRPGDDAYANLGDPVVPGLIDRVNAVAKIRIESQEGGVLTFQRLKDAKSWGIVERDMYPAEANKLSSLALRVAQLTYLAPKTTKPELFGRLELGDPTKKGTQSTALKLLDKGGKALADLVIGKARGAIEGSTHGGAYFRIAGENQTWVGRGNMEVDRLVFDWINRHLFDIKTKRIQSVEIVHPDGEKIHIFKDQAEDADFVLADVPGDRKIIDRFKVNGLASAIGDYQVLDLVKRGKQPKGGTLGARLTYQTFDGLTITVQQSSHQVKVDGEMEAEHWIDVRVSGDGATGDTATELARLKARTDDWVYKISDFRHDSLAKRMKDLTEAAKGS